MNNAPLKSDLVHLGILMGLCLLIGVCLIWGTVLINPDGVFYIGQARQFTQDVASLGERCPAGYPFLLWVGHQAATFLAGRDSPMVWLYSSQAVTLLCRILALIPLYFFGKLLIGAANSFWALLILVFLPYPARFGSDVLREWPYVLFLGLGFWLLYRGVHCRQRWVFPLAGLAAGLGSLIRPECAQLVLYGLIGLAFGYDGKTGMVLPGRGRGGMLWGAGLLLIAGFLVPVAPYVYATGRILPQQLRPDISNAPPAFSAVGPKAACDEPLEFEAREGELLELPIKAADPDGDPLTYSLLTVPMGLRPIYEFRSSSTGDCIWTASQYEKDLVLTTYPRELWEYKGIAFYTYVQPDARPGLLLVRRFWLPGQQRHLYTTDEAEVRALIEQTPKDAWSHEGVAFYAFGPDDPPPDAVPVYRTGTRERGCSWVVGSGSRSVPPGSQAGTVVWYVEMGRKAPTGAAIEGGVFRWRPTPGQAGDYQINLIISDGELQSCQLVRIRVAAKQDAAVGETRDKSQGGEYRSLPPAVPHPQASETSSAESCLPLQHAGLEKLPDAVRRILAALIEDLMVILAVPWGIGLYYRLRDRAERTERILVTAVVIVNIGLMLGRHVGFDDGDDRRYGLGLIVLTIFYVPVGLEIMAEWLTRRKLPVLPGFSWFHVLVAVGIVVCLPKLLLPSPGNKVGYRAAAEWLHRHTRAEDVLAVPDVRIGFYAQRQGLFYRQYPNWGKADHVVLMDREGRVQVPEGWRQEYSVAIDRRNKGTLVIYSTERP